MVLRLYRCSSGESRRRRADGRSGDVAVHDGGKDARPG